MSVELLQGEAFEDAFGSFTRSAFHLEVNDSYHTPEESGPFALFLNGEPDDLAWHRPWLNLVQQVTAAGRQINRVRVVSVPHVDYTRWGLTIAEHNIAAGEDIRWLPRHLIDPHQLSRDDFWLLDDDRVMFTVFAPSGQFCGGALTDDPSIVDYCRAVRDRAWALAIPHHEYVASQYTTA